MADDAARHAEEAGAAKPIFAFANFFKVPRSKAVNVSDVCAGTVAGPSIDAPCWKTLCASFALTMFGADLWMISRYGNPTPFWDEWGALASDLFVPYFDSTLSLQQLFAIHVEHRVFTTRIVSLALIAANGIWDPILQMVVNAAIHVALGVCILAMFRKYLDNRAFVATTVFTTLLMTIPFATESLLLCFNTHFYCVLLFGLIGINLVVRESGFSVLRLLGWLAAILSFLSMASGILVFAACAIVVIVKRLLGVENGWREVAIAVLLAACFVFALRTTPISTSSETFGAHSLLDFIGAFVTVASWPLPGNILGAAFVNLPWLILVWRTLSRPPSSASVCWAILAIGLWNGLQFASLAFGRAAMIISSRYLDIFIFGLIINFAYAAMASDTIRKKLLLAGWVAVIFAGLIYRAWNIPEELQNRHRIGLMQEKTVRTFLSTGSFPPDAKVADFSLPFPNPMWLAERLSDKRVQRFLPSNLQGAIVERPGAVQPLARRDRLGNVRDALLRAGPFLFLTGLLLLFAVLLRSALNRRAVPGH